MSDYRFADAGKPIRGRVPDHIADAGKMIAAGLFDHFGNAGKMVQHLLVKERP